MKYMLAQMCGPSDGWTQTAFESDTFLVMDDLDITDVYLLVELASQYLPTICFLKSSSTACRCKP